jgi:polyphenol oxidase
MNPASDAVWLAADWPAPDGVHGGTTLRGWWGGASAAPRGRFNLASHVGDDTGSVERNRRALREALNLPQEPAWLTQVHGIRLRDLDEPGAAAEPADGACTRRAGYIPVVLTADCLPVLLCSQDGQWVAALHAGWRGLAAGILEAGVRAAGCQPGQLMAWLGPAIGQTCFEVDAPVRDAFCAQSAEAEQAFLVNRPGHWLCDLECLARQRLRAAGVLQVYGGGRCTASEPERFHSYRRDGLHSGRMATLIWRDPQAQAGAVD